MTHRVEFSITTPEIDSDTLDKHKYTSAYSNSDNAYFHGYILCQEILIHITLPSTIRMPQTIVVGALEYIPDIQIVMCDQSFSIIVCWPCG